MVRRRQRRTKPNLEEVLQYIGKKYIKLDKGRIRSANSYLSRVLYKITRAMNRVSPLFKAMFETFLYAGSSYDGLKIGKPDEFDIDLKLHLPDILDVQVHPSDRDGFVHIQLKDWDELKKDKQLYNTYSELEILKDDQHYLSQEKTKRWMQSIVAQAINQINDSGTFENELQIIQTMGGPAVTVHIIKSKEKMMSIDLVAVFRMPGEKWPPYPVRENISEEKEDYVVVPKPPKEMDKMRKLRANPERYWRLSFPEQEMEFMNDYNFCKPILRLFKKMRDTRSHNIPSYFIKTIFLWEIEDREETNDNRSFWRTSLTNVFLVMLTKYKTFIENHEINYFWAENNFLEPYSRSNITVIRNYLERMINHINIIKESDPVVVAEYLLSTDEYEHVRDYMNRKYNT